MDRTGWIGIIVCIVLLVAYQPTLNHFYPPKPRPAVQPVHTTSTNAPTTLSPLPALTGTNAPHPAATPVAPVATPQVLQSPEFVLRREPATQPRVTPVLENDFIAVTFTTAGGGILRTSVKKHLTTGKNPVTIHPGSDEREPILNLTGWDSDYDLLHYRITELTPTTITFQRTLRNGETLTRTYTLGSDYLLTLHQTIQNPATTDRVLPPPILFIGLGESVYQKEEGRIYLGGAWYTTKGSFFTHKIVEFDPSNFLFLFHSAGKQMISSNPGDEITWAASKNQFFTTVITPKNEKGQKVDLRKVHLSELAHGGIIPDAVDVRLTLPGVVLPAGKTVEQDYQIYIGPKEYDRLNAMGANQERIMEWGWLSIFCTPLLWVMNFLHGLIPNYGVAIILLTVLLKAALWMPQSYANRNMRQMQELSPKLKELQTKYKEDPKKLQEEMFKLYRAYNVSPLGGCLPMLIQLPLFLGFYYMLQSAIELRGSSFLWIPDLSQPDTLFHIPLTFLFGVGYDIPFNLMPIIMALTMLWTMHITPQPEGVDNPMVNAMKIMPLIMLYFCYNFSAALSLYWTMQNLLSILQMYVNLQQPPPPLEKAKKPKKGLLS